MSALAAGGSDTPPSSQDEVPGERKVLETLGWLREHLTFPQSGTSSHPHRLHFSQARGGLLNTGVQPGGAVGESAECMGGLEEGIIGRGSQGEPMLACWLVLLMLIGRLSQALR